MGDEHAAGLKLIEQGSLVAFDLVNTTIDESVGGDETIVRIDLTLGELEDDGDLEDGEEPHRTEDHEWGGLGFRV